MPVPAIVSWIDENWQNVECQFYSGVQNGAFNAAIGSAFTGKIPLAMGLAGISYAAGWTAEQAGCGYTEPEPENKPEVEGCIKFSSGRGTLYWNEKGKPAPGRIISFAVSEVLRIEEAMYGLPKEPCWEVFYVLKRDDGSTEERSSWWYKRATDFPLVRLIPDEGAVCETPAPGIEPDPHNPGDPIADPINHVIDDCTWTIQATEAYVDDQMVWHTYYVISADNDSCGGPFAYWSSDKGPQWVAPNPPGPVFPDPNPPSPLPPRDYNPRFDDIDDDLDEIQKELEKLKECACPEEEPIEGEFRTISFRSDETSPFGKSRLRKRLRYRSRSGLELGALVDHWKDFTWQSGAVRVQHLGASWGAPSVWAVDADEGKRVLLHAAGEAGIDPNQVGRWKVGSSNNSRIGVSDTMRVDTTGGYYWITARDGSDQRPLVQER